jgi:diaminohydroxyphosphoribosylaminopyrimidine deaminase/5-amino-6-(5-phosphoribosylamino)uracil reductase
LFSRFFCGQENRREGFEMTDEKFMQRALDLARKGYGTASPNPMVGAVVVKNGKIVGEGFHEKPGSPHAEVFALNEAGKKARGATLFVTLEPCNHQGRTPPCTQKVLASGVAEVVCAMKDPNPLVAGGGLEMLAEQGVKTRCGVLEQEARRLNEAFITWICTGRPFVTAKCAATLDGRIATRTGDSKWISNEKSRAFAHWLRFGADAILVGAGTMRADNPRLTVRLEGDAKKNPHKVVIDPNLTTPPDARVLHGDDDSATYLFCGPHAPQGRRAALAGEGAQIICVPEKDGRLALGSVLDELGRRRIASILLEGGAQVLGAAFREGLVDKVFFFFAPKILGGDDGTPITSGAGAGLIADCTQLFDISVHRFDDDVCIEGYIKKEW